MKIRELPMVWESYRARGQTLNYSMALTMQQAARIEALVEMYPQRSKSLILSDLIGCALAELEAGMPYKQGDRVVSEDEEGNPVYEDVGPTPQFMQLSHKYLQALQASPSEPH